MKSLALLVTLSSSIAALGDPNRLSSKARAIYKHVWATTFEHPSEMSVTAEHILSSGTLLTDVSAYGDGSEHCNLLYETMMRAEQEVLIGTYTFDRTSLCGKLARLAIERLSQRGRPVRIYALIDAFSQLNIWKQNPFKVPVDLRDIASNRRTTRGSIFGLPDMASLSKGIEFVVKTMHIGIYGAMHSKMLVVDGRWVVFGSKNWEALPAHEYSALMEGPIVGSFRGDFQRLWDAPLPPLQPPFQDPTTLPGGVPMLYLGRRPASSFPSINDKSAQDQAWIKAVELAQRYILLISPNVNTQSFMDRLLVAIRRGVKVIIITNWSFHDFGEKLYPDSTGSNKDTFEYLRKRLGRGEEKRLTACYFMGQRVQPPRPLEKEITHTKYMDVDGEFSIFGSGNYDPQSFYYSSEANVLVDDARETQRITAKMFSEQQSLEHCFYDSGGKREYNATLNWTRQFG